MFILTTPLHHYHTVIISQPHPLQMITKNLFEMSLKQTTYNIQKFHQKLIILMVFALDNTRKKYMEVLRFYSDWRKK